MGYRAFSPPDYELKSDSWLWKQIGVIMWRLFQGLSGTCLKVFGLFHITKPITAIGSNCSINMEVNNWALSFALQDVAPLSPKYKVKLCLLGDVSFLYPVLDCLVKLDFYMSLSPSSYNISYSKHYSSTNQEEEVKRISIFGFDFQEEVDIKGNEVCLF